MNPFKIVKNHLLKTREGYTQKIRRHIFSFPVVQPRWTDPADQEDYGGQPGGDRHQGLQGLHRDGYQVP